MDEAEKRRAKGAHANHVSFPLACGTKLAVHPQNHRFWDTQGEIPSAEPLFVFSPAKHTRFVLKHSADRILAKLPNLRQFGNGIMAFG